MSKPIDLMNTGLYAEKVRLRARVEYLEQTISQRGAAMSTKSERATWNPVTMFAVGDVVESLVNAQGLKRGHVYTVTGVDVRSTAFGGFTMYTLGGYAISGVSVVNGHLVLRRRAS